jgi:hypothetical protein
MTIVRNNANESNIDQLLSVESGTSNQPIAQLRTTNIILGQTSSILNHPQYDNGIRPQHARRGRRQQQQQEEQLHAIQRQQEQQLQQQQSLRRQQANSRRYNRSLERRRQNEERRQTVNHRFEYNDSYVDRTDRMAFRLHLEDQANMYASDEYEQQQVIEHEEF